MTALISKARGIIDDAPINCKPIAFKRCFLRRILRIPTSDQCAFHAGAFCANMDRSILALAAAYMDEPTDSFRQRVFQIIAAIPAGSITTYGEVALLAGSPRAARQVGGILSRLPEGTALPWHRVLNRHGGISLPGEGFRRQKAALEAEGIEINNQGTVSLERYRWQW